MFEWVTFSLRSVTFALYMLRMLVSIVAAADSFTSAGFLSILAWIIVISALTFMAMMLLIFVPSVSLVDQRMKRWSATNHHVVVLLAWLFSTGVWSLGILALDHYYRRPLVPARYGPLLRMGLAVDCVPVLMGLLVMSVEIERYSAPKSKRAQ